MKMISKQIIVSIEIDSKNIPVGTLWFHFRKGRSSASFEYTDTWLNYPKRFAIEPALKLNKASFHTESSCDLFRVFADSAPDRWGRVLMQRAHIAQAKLKSTIPPTLTEIDYLLGVNDQARQGALRFSLPEQPAKFLTTDSNKVIPPLIDLPKLLSATEHYLDNHESSSDLKLLLAPGSSLGGARPKASILGKNNNLAIAKFPRKDDEFNVVLWEAVALTLAKISGIKVPEWHVEKILQKPVLIINRFDRLKNQRLHFISAMTMLSANDNEQHSYLEIVYALLKYGASPKQDLLELWRRIVFTIMISNTDDHLRNHGFIYQLHQGWRLAPVYDINPTPIHIRPKILTTAIDFEDNSASLNKAMSVIDQFRLTKDNALKIVDQVKQAVEQWRKVAKQFGLTKAECDYMASAFDYQ